MLIYHIRCSENCTCRTVNINTKKEYKSANNRKHPGYSSTSVCGERSSTSVCREKTKKPIVSKPKKAKVSRKEKKITNKNAQFLKGLGLKVKQSVENC